jgi:hypothetical protein
MLVPVTLQGVAQEDTASVNRKRLNFLLVGGSVAYAGTMVGLYNLWYKDDLTPSFHFVNDCNYWGGMDKLGHATTSYWIGRISYHALKWADVKEKHAVWYGGSAGLVFLTTVEIFDGFSNDWGASLCDMAANVAGAGLFIGQQLGWKEQRLLLKFSYHPTEFPQYRPDALGSTPIQRIIKDYNGQTFWLSGNIHSFIRKESRFPAWLNLAAGYGITGFTGATGNPSDYEGEPIPYYKRTKQFFLTLDVDLTRIKTRSKVLKGVFTLLGFIKIPMPTIEYNTRGKFVFHYLYF